MPDYGRHIDWLRDISTAGKTITGPELVAQDIIHLLITVRGTNPRNPSRGFGITQEILSGYTPETLPALASSIETTLLEDERILAAEVDASIDTGTWALSLRVDLVDGSSFLLVGPIGDLRVELLANGE